MLVYFESFVPGLAFNISQAFVIGRFKHLILLSFIVFHIKLLTALCLSHDSFQVIVHPAPEKALTQKELTP